MPADADSDSSTQPQNDLFADIYERTNRGYGEMPSAVLKSFLAGESHRGDAYDLGAGAGRDTFAMLAAGFNVACFDASPTGLERVKERAEQSGMGERVRLHCGDVREIDFPQCKLDLIVATTILDHVPAGDARKLWDAMCSALVPGGYLYVEVHTTDDPACENAPEAYRRAPSSETAHAVINYFKQNELASWAIAEDSQLRVRHYEERLEWDQTHGVDHLHGKAILLAERLGGHRQWYGEVPIEKPPKEIRDQISRR